MPIVWLTEAAGLASGTVSGGAWASTAPAIRTKAAKARTKRVFIGLPPSTVLEESYAKRMKGFRTGGCSLGEGSDAISPLSSAGSRSDPPGIRALGGGDSVSAVVAGALQRAEQQVGTA